MESKPTPEEETPQCFIDYLSENDRIGYENLKIKVGSPDNRYNRNKRLETFIEILNDIRVFCVRNDEDDWKRYLVCGICWLGPDLALNTFQLRTLLAKSKSTVNGVLAKLGYDPVPLNSKNSECLLVKIPFLKTHFNEMRQWTLRKMIFSNPASAFGNQYIPYTTICSPISVNFSINDSCNNAVNIDKSKIALNNCSSSSLNTCSNCVNSVSLDSFDNGMYNNVDESILYNNNNSNNNPNYNLNNNFAIKSNVNIDEFNTVDIMSSFRQYVKLKDKKGNDETKSDILEPFETFIYFGDDTSGSGLENENDFFNGNNF